MFEPKSPKVWTVMGLMAILFTSLVFQKAWGAGETLPIAPRRADDRDQLPSEPFTSISGRDPVIEVTPSAVPQANKKTVNRKLAFDEAPEPKLRPATKTAVKKTVAKKNAAKTTKKPSPQKSAKTKPIEAKKKGAVVAKPSPAKRKNVTKAKKPESRKPASKKNKK